MNSVDEATIAKDKTNGMVCKLCRHGQILFFLANVMFIINLLRKSMVEICVSIIR